MAQILTSTCFLEFTHELQKELPTKEINIAYVGGVSQDITRTFSLMTESSLERQQERTIVLRKVFNVMVESLQNISRHAEILPGDSEDSRRGVILISHNDELYNIVTGNVILKKQIDALRQRIDKINAMDKIELSKAYKKQILEGEIAEHGGAGLGFLDIAKKSGHPIEYRFYDIEGLPEHCFFMSIATIDRES